MLHYTRNQLTSLSLAVIFISILLIQACAPPQPTAIKKESQESAQTYRVDLPKQIDLEALIPPLKHADGSYRVDGLLMRSRQYLGNEMTLRGYVVEMPKCKNKDGEICAKPHLWLADAIGHNQERLRVVGFTRKKLRKFKLNKAYKITGKFVQTHEDGFVSSDGLLVYQSVEKIK